MPAIVLSRTAPPVLPRVCVISGATVGVEDFEVPFGFVVPRAGPALPGMVGAAWSLASEVASTGRPSGVDREGRQELVLSLPFSPTAHRRWKRGRALATGAAFVGGLSLIGLFAWILTLAGLHERPSVGSLAAMFCLAAIGVVGGGVAVGVRRVLRGPRLLKVGPALIEVWVPSEAFVRVHTQARGEGTERR